MPSYLLSPSDVADVQITVQGIGSLLLCYGVQTGLFFAAIPALVRKSSRASRILTALVTLLFLSSTLGVFTYVILLSLLLKIGIGASPSSYLPLISKLDVAHAVTARLNYIISDAIVVWRAWILWPNNRIAQGLLLVCMAYSGCVLKTICPHSRLIDVCARGARQLVAVIVNGALQANMSASPVPHTIARSAMLVTNAVATPLVAIKLWLYRRNVSASMKLMSGGGQVGGVLVLLVESGVVYCVVWILEMSSINRSVDYLMNFGALTFVLAGIYPTFIVLVVTLQQHATAQAMIGTHTAGVPEPLRFATRRESLCFTTNCGEALSEGDRGEGLCSWDSVNGWNERNREDSSSNETIGDGRSVQEEAYELRGRLARA